MDYGINIDYFIRSIGVEKAADLIKAAGFSFVDYTPPLKADDWETIMKKDFEVIKSYDLTVHQTHAPFNRYGTYGNNHIVCMDRCMEATAFMGAKYVAVHGDEFDFENLTYSPDKALEYNHNYFAPYVEKAEKLGFKMAFETVFEEHPTRKRFTAQPNDLLNLILSFNSQSAVCCWDSGHANISYRKTAPEWIEKFGSLIQCTHIHDNTGNDSHQIPSTGDIDWKNVTDAFKKIGYSGVISVELGHGNVPERYISDFISFTKNVTEELWK